MNIAHLLPYSAVFPLAKHNGRYEWALKLARQQAKNGHQVTVYAGPHSTDSSPIRWRSLAKGKGGKKQNNKALAEAALTNIEHDVFHSHFDSLHYSLAYLTSRPIIVTQHWFPTASIAAAARNFTGQNTFVIPVTHYMEQKDAELGIKTKRMIYHGIDLSLFRPISAQPSSRFIFVGRITPAKGVREAVTLAKKAAIQLDIIGKVNEADQAYWQSILPSVDGDAIRYLGPQPQEKVAYFFQKAQALLFPSQHEEAFGQVTIEAQASGIPVIIRDIGASCELVQHGITGFVCSTEDDYLQAIKKIDSIDRHACRAFAETFSSDTMYSAYDQLYKELVRP